MTAHSIQQHRIPVAYTDMKQIDKLVVKALGITFVQSHPVPLPLSAASGFRPQCHARRFSAVGGCQKGQGLSRGRYRQFDNNLSAVSPNLKLLTLIF